MCVRERGREGVKEGGCEPLCVTACGGVLASQAGRWDTGGRRMK